MSRLQWSVRIEPSLPGGDASRVSVFAPLGDERACMAIYTGEATVHLRMTPAEVRELIYALRCALAPHEAVEVAA